MTKPSYTITIACTNAALRTYSYTSLADAQEAYGETISAYSHEGKSAVVQLLGPTGATLRAASCAI